MVFVLEIENVLKVWEDFGRITMKGTRDSIKGGEYGKIQTELKEIGSIKLLSVTICLNKKYLWSMEIDPNPPI